jgi:hypothetical protein
MVVIGFDTNILTGFLVTSYKQAFLFLVHLYSVSCRPRLYHPFPEIFVWVGRLPGDVSVSSLVKTVAQRIALGHYRKCLAGGYPWAN